MKNILSLSVLAIAIMAFACNQGRQKVGDEKLIRDILNEYVVSIQNRDIDLYSTLVAHDTSMVNYNMFGDPIIGWRALMEAIANQDSVLSNAKINVMNLEIHVDRGSDMAWATGMWELTANMWNKPVALPVRCTWILQNGEQGWAIVHFHNSVAIEG